VGKPLSEYPLVEALKEGVQLTEVMAQCDIKELMGVVTRPGRELWDYAMTLPLYGIPEVTDFADEAARLAKALHAFHNQLDNWLRFRQATAVVMVKDGVPLTMGDHERSKQEAVPHVTL